MGAGGAKPTRRLLCLRHRRAASSTPSLLSRVGTATEPQLHTGVQAKILAQVLLFPSLAPPPCWADITFPVWG